MHGLIFETSVWLLAGSTRLLSYRRTRQKVIQRNTFYQVLLFCFFGLKKKKRDCGIEANQTQSFFNFFDNQKILNRIFNVWTKSVRADSKKRTRQTTSFKPPRITGITYVLAEKSSLSLAVEKQWRENTSSTTWRTLDQSKPTVRGLNPI